uniref:RNA polymerase II-associated factor 1 homolog n=1 Tax=Microcebus murinus TaxID=30608 RepID=A0A8C5XQ99_MICMU
MAPTIQTQAQREDGHRSGVVCRVKYCNSLPDIPFDPKFITYPFDQNRFVQYKATSLEKQHKHDLLTEPDLGVTIDLINPDTYRIDPNVLLDPADEKLLEEEIQAPTSSKRSQQHAKVVPWMRKTEYISTEFNRYGISNEKPEVKIGVSVKQQFTEEEIYKDRDSQITAIEKTFEDAQKSGKGVVPDDTSGGHASPKDTSGAAALEMMSQAMIRGMMDEEGNQFVAYFLPVEETLKKRKRDQEEEMDYAPDDVYDYKIAREYNWNVKNKASKGYEENYFFIFREGDGVYYNELETRVRLSKRRAKAGVQSGTNALLVVKHRDMNEKELEAQEARKAQLENHEPEEEEEEEMETEDKEAGGSDDEEREKGSSSEKEGSEDERSGSESDREEGDRDEASDKSGSGEDESSEDEARAARDKEEIFGSDADSEDDADSDDDDRGQAQGGSDNDSDSGSDGGGQRSRSRSRSRSASPFPSGSEHSAQEDGSDAVASDSSEADSDSD